MVGIRIAYHLDGLLRFGSVGPLSFSRAFGRWWSKTPNVFAGVLHRLSSTRHSNKPQPIANLGHW